MGLVARDDGFGILGEGDAVGRVGEMLRLRSGRVERVEGDDALILGRRLVEEAGGVFKVNDRVTLKMPWPSSSGAMAMGRFFQ